MLLNYLTSMILMIVLTCGWLAVQRMWRRHFPGDDATDGDALANRNSCVGCTCDKSQRPETACNQPTMEAPENAPARL